MLQQTTRAIRAPIARRPMVVTRKKTGSGYLGQFLRTSGPLIVADTIACLLSLLIGYIIADTLSPATVVINSHLAWFAVCCLLALFLVLGLYSGIGMNPIYEFRQCTIGVVVSYLLIVGARVTMANSMAILLAFPIMLVLVSIIRAAARHLLAMTDWWGVNCLVYSCDRRVRRLYAMHQKNATGGFRPVGFVQEELPDECEELADYWLGKPEQTERLMEENNAHVAILHRRGRPDHEIAEYVERHLSSFTQVVVVPDDERIPSLWSMGKDGGLLIKDRLLQPGNQLLKRLVDVTVSCSVLMLGMPLFLLIAVWLKVTSPGPLFYGHARIGRGGRKFKAWKFRSMCVNADEVLKETLASNPEMRAEWEATQKLKNDPRVSSSGRFLRKTSLDEIPQLWNVLLGQMSLVGPRPIVANEIEKYQDKIKSYTRVTPGVTGFWQISGRNLTTYERRVELDDYYVRNWSVWFDFYILFRTVKTVLLREGAF